MEITICLLSVNYLLLLQQAKILRTIMIRLHFKINFYRIVEQKKFNAIIQWRLIRIQSKIGVQFGTFWKLQKKKDIC